MGPNSIMIGSISMHQNTCNHKCKPLYKNVQFQLELSGHVYQVFLFNDPGFFYLFLFVQFIKNIFLVLTILGE